MKGRAETPELDQRIAAHANAIASGDTAAAEKFVSPAAGGEHREIVARYVGGGAISDVRPMGKAKIGFQYMSKLWFTRGGERLVMLNRWRNEDGQWRIASSEDLTGKRSPWSDIEKPPGLNTGNTHG
jgi:hypothetical protein